MRKYSGIWHLLKKDKKCAIAAMPKLHLRIIKGVITEKYKDLGYKVEMDEQDKWAKIEYTRDGAKIEFKLVVYGVNVTDL